MAVPVSRGRIAVRHLGRRVIAVALVAGSFFISIEPWWVWRRDRHKIVYGMTGEQHTNTKVPSRYGWSARRLNLSWGALAKPIRGTVDRSHYKISASQLRFAQEGRW